MSVSLSHPGKKKITYRELLILTRRKRKPFNKIIEHWKSTDLTYSKKLRKTYIEIALSYHAVKKIISDVRRYGDDIKRGYGRSKTKQFLQQIYLHFLLGIDSVNYRIYLLYKMDRWKFVKDFTYRNQDIEKQFYSISNSISDLTYQSDYDLLNNKFQFYKYCLDNEIPTPTILATIDLNETAGALDFDDTSFKQDFFIKVVDGGAGYGAAKFYYRNDHHQDEQGEIYSSQDILNFLENTQYHSASDSRGRFIVQPVINNHKDWQRFTSGALATCRILTGKGLDNRDIIPISAVLRMPTGSAIVDNFAAGGIVSPINMDTGEMGTAVSYEPRNGSFEHDYHPDTGKKLKGVILPGWNELVKFTSTVHKTFNFIFVGWDIAYTSEGFVVVEGNPVNWSCDVLESPHNCPLLKTKYPGLFDQWIRHFTKRQYEPTENKG